MNGSTEVRKPLTAPPIPPVDSKPPLISTSDRVGFSSLPDQIVKRAVKNGFTFNILCIGETGIGKSTLLNSLFNMNFTFPPCVDELKTVELKSSVFDVEEGGVRLKLTLVETAGFGAQQEKENGVKTIADYIDKQFEAFLQEELKIKRCMPLYQDTRIHACLYLISPLGHGLKALDVSALKELCHRVNIIPIIAQADTLSKGALDTLKKKILSGLKTSELESYNFPTDDDTVKDTNSALNHTLPFAVIGSTDFVNKDGKMVRARQYPWGIVEVENQDHCDFVKLREALLRLNVEDLRQKTHRHLYENYRRRRLVAMGMKDGDLGVGLQQTYQQRSREHVAWMKQKEEERKISFIKRVEAKEHELKEKEKVLLSRQEVENRKYQIEVAKMDEDERQLEKEITDFERVKKVILQKRK